MCMTRVDCFRSRSLYVNVLSTHRPSAGMSQVFGVESLDCRMELSCSFGGNCRVIGGPGRSRSKY